MSEVCKFCGHEYNLTVVDNCTHIPTHSCKDSQIAVLQADLQKFQGEEVTMSDCRCPQGYRDILGEPAHSTICLKGQIAALQAELAELKRLLGYRDEQIKSLLERIEHGEL